MKFSNARQKAPGKASREMNTGVNKRMTLDDQFNSFVAVVSIASDDEVPIINRLRDTGGNLIIPGEWHVIDAVGAATGSLTRGTTPWTLEKLYLTNKSVNDGKFKVRFFARPRTGKDDSTQILELD